MTEVKTSLSKKGTTHMSTLVAAATLTLQIRCINKTDRMNPHERIKNIGGLNDDKTPWKLSLNDAIVGIKQGKYKFWVTADGKSVWVVIARSAAGHEYLKTENDGEHPNNLLSLPECP